MKKKIIVFAILSLLFVVNVNAKEMEYYVNKENVKISAEKYNNLLKMGYTQEMIDNITEENYESFGDLDFVESKTEEKYFRETTINGYKTTKTFVEEITESEYNNEEKADINSLVNISNIQDVGATGSHETSYKKLTVTVTKSSLANPARRMVVGSLVWKNLPVVRSYDIFAARVTNGGIIANTNNGTMTRKTTRLDSQCVYNGETSYTTNYGSSNSAWNLDSNGLGYNGIGFTGKLSTDVDICFSDVGPITTQIIGYSSTISFSGNASSPTGKLNVYVSYQHASTNVNYNSVYQAYTFSNSGLGNVVYFSNTTLRNSYDGMGGVNVNF